MRVTTLFFVGLVALSVVGCQEQPVYQSALPPHRSMSQLKPNAPVENDLIVGEEAGTPLLPPVAHMSPQIDETTTFAATDKPAGDPFDPSVAEVPVNQAGASQIYAIRYRDTLWSIADSRLGSGKRWKEIAAINPAINPRNLRPGQVIHLPTR